MEVSGTLRSRKQDNGLQIQIKQYENTPLIGNRMGIYYGKKYWDNSFRI